MHSTKHFLSFFRPGWLFFCLLFTSQPCFTQIIIPLKTGPGINPAEAIRLAIQSAEKDFPEDSVKLINIPPGQYYFQAPIIIHTSHIYLWGKQAESTEFIFDLGGKNLPCMVAEGKQGLIPYPLQANKNTYPIGSDRLLLNQARGLNRGDWVLLQAWRKGKDSRKGEIEVQTGQMMRLRSVDTVTGWVGLEDTLRQDYRLDDSALMEPLQVVRLFPVTDFEIKNITIIRKDRVKGIARNNSANIHLKLVVESKLEGLISKNCQFAHVALSECSRVEVRAGYFHHAQAYGGGEGYGLVLQHASGDCRVEQNRFEHLRHSILLQWGANGNSIVRNESKSPHWHQGILPAGVAGDLVLHGNFPYANVFEENECMQVVVDASHGPNGGGNIFIRNRIHGYGVYVSRKENSQLIFLENQLTPGGMRRLKRSCKRTSIRCEGNLLFKQ